METLNPSSVGRDEDLKLIPIAEITAKNPRETAVSSFPLIVYGDIHMETVSFKERVAQAAIDQAKKYKDVFVDNEYLLCSEAFVKRDYYIIAATTSNYRHLIGVNTSISAEDFFEKCINGTLTEHDFDFNKSGRTEKEIKGSVRRKVRSLPIFMSMIGVDLVAQEDYTKNGVCCSLATTDCNMTVGFVNEGKARPKSLLWGDSLDWAKAGSVDLILKRKTGDALFTEIAFGDPSMLLKYQDKIKAIAAPELFEKFAVSGKI